MNPKISTGTMRALEECIADSSRPEKIRRACALRLSRLRAAARTPATGPRLTTSATRTKAAPAKPAPLPVPTEKARYEALQSFLALSRHRSALHRKRRTAGEQDVFNAMVALMPATAPTSDDPQQWRDFIARVSAILEEIKSTK
jgi:hypothetical protein